MAETADQLFGRAAEVGLFDTALDDLDAGRPGALALVGEPGIGKTRLMAELAARGDARGHIVLQGSASELELDLPWWVFVDALDEYVAGLDPRRVSSLEADMLAELAQILPSLGEFRAAGDAPLQDERYRAHRAMAGLLERLAGTKPLVLILDDVHWADSASVELLGALLRRPPDAAVLLAMGARPRQLAERLEGAFGRAVRDGALARVDLGGLERSDAGLLLGSEIAPAAADSIFAASGGNPFYLEQLARVGVADGPASGSAADVELAGVAVPGVVAAALVEELGLLTPGTREFLQGASVAGDPFEPDLAGAAAGVEESAAMGALDELLAFDLVRPTDVPRRFRFRHPLVRRIVYENSPAGWRLGAHERCADALAARGAAAQTRAHHVEHAARPGDMEAVAVLREAGEGAALRAPASAARWFGAALRILPDGAAPDERVPLLLARATALAATGDLPASHADLIASVALVPPALGDLKVRLVAACAGVEHLLGHHDDAHRRLVTALEDLPDPAAPEAVALRIEVALDGLFRTEYVEMRDAARPALEAAKKLGDPGLTATSASVLALALAFTGEIAEAETVRAEAAGLVDALTDEELVPRPDAGAHLAAAEIYLDRYEDAGIHAARAMEAGRAAGGRYPTLVPTLGTARFMRGRFPEAIEVLEGGVDAARLTHNTQAIAWSLFNRGMCALYAGEFELARSVTEESFALAQQLDESFVSAWASLALALARQATGDPSGAVTVVAAAGGDELPAIPGGWRALGFERLTRAYLDLGRREDAARLVGLADARAAAVPLPMTQAWASRAAAALALADGDAPAAIERALRAIAGADTAEVPVEAAFSRIVAGRAYALAGDEEQAAAMFDRAAADLEACGAFRHRNAAEAELGKLGRRVSRRSRAGSADAEGVASLSARELEVARLVVDRRTNREIAEELFLSLKTVESHMRNLFRKLGVSSRVEVARVVERELS